MLKTHTRETSVFSDADVLLTSKEAAEYLRKSEPTLERWRRTGIGPAPIRVGPRSVRYRLTDLRKFIGADAVEAA